VGTSRSADEFAVKLYRYGTALNRGQLEAMRNSRRRMEAALKRAAIELAGPDQILSRVGRATGYGTRKGGKLTVRTQSETLAMSVTFIAGGPWSLRDSTVSGGPTQAHVIGPRPDKNKRPLTPAVKYKPSMKFRSGRYVSGIVRHPGSKRTDAWRRQVQSTSPRIIVEHAREFARAGTETFGGS
jgi:hypothetical protein